MFSVNLQFFLILCLGIRTITGVQKNSTRTREGRNFGRNQPSYEMCNTQNGIRGVCMKRSECIRSNGNASGFCGIYGVCCDINMACDAVSKAKRTVMRNPIPLPNRCTYHFQPFSPNVCQLRLDFDMVLAQPEIPDATNNVNAITCVRDVFQVGGLRICGTNMNQHIYVPFDAASGIGDVSISFTLSKRNQISSTAFWNMVVTQLECPPTARQTTQTPGLPPTNSLRYLKNLLRAPNNDSELLAPPGCLQYFPESQGTFESFNYNNGQGPYMGNLRYGICIRRTTLDNAVQFLANTFEIGAAGNTNGFIDGDCHDVLGTPGRSNDYLAVPESVLATAPPSYGTYYCGTSIQNTDLLHAPPGPFAIYFNSDNLYSTQFPERGFRISYSVQ